MVCSLNSEPTSGESLEISRNEPLTLECNSCDKNPKLQIDVTFNITPAQKCAQATSDALKICPAD